MLMLLFNSAAGLLTHTCPFLSYPLCVHVWAARRAHVYTSRRVPRAPCEAKSGSVKRSAPWAILRQAMNVKNCLFVKDSWMNWMSELRGSRKETDEGFTRKVYRVYPCWWVNISTICCYGWWSEFLWESQFVCLCLCAQGGPILHGLHLFMILSISSLAFWEALSSFTHFEDNLPFLFALCYFSWTLHERVSNLKFEPIFCIFWKRCDCKKWKCAHVNAFFGSSQQSIYISYLFVFIVLFNCDENDR
jgi:hypothetical protein